MSTIDVSSHGIYFVCYLRYFTPRRFQKLGSVSSGRFTKTARSLEYDRIHVNLSHSHFTTKKPAPHPERRPPYPSWHPTQSPTRTYNVIIKGRRLPIEIKSGVRFKWSPISVYNGHQWPFLMDVHFHLLYLKKPILFGRSCIFQTTDHGLLKRTHA